MGPSRNRASLIHSAFWVARMALALTFPFRRHSLLTQPLPVAWPAVLFCLRLRLPVFSGWRLIVLSNVARFRKLSPPRFVILFASSCFALLRWMVAQVSRQRYLVLALAQSKNKVAFLCSGQYSWTSARRLFDHALGLALAEYILSMAQSGDLIFSVGRELDDISKAFRIRSSRTPSRYHHGCSHGRAICNDHDEAVKATM